MSKKDIFAFAKFGLFFKTEAVVSPCFIALLVLKCIGIKKK
jgi:hypothetical protein